MKNTNLILLFFLIAIQFKSYSQYCASVPSSPVDGSDIGIFKLGSFTNTSIANAATVNSLNPFATATYSDFTSLSPIGLLAGVSIPISITQVNEFSFNASFAKVWIDLNHDSIFQNPGELVFTSTQSIDPSLAVGGNVLFGSISIPGLGTNVLSGITRLRIVLSEENPSTTISPCSSPSYLFGETEDYLVNIQAASSCAGVPTAGTVLISKDSVCLGELVNLSLNGSTTASGLSYQWQSAQNLSGPFVNINGATNSTFLSTVTGNLFFQCIVTCSNSGQSSTTLPDGYSVKPLVLCLCSSKAFSNSDEDIGNITFASLNNGIATPAINNSTAINTYSNFTNLPPTVLLSPLNIPIQITQINSDTFFAAGVKVWIDFNQDRVFQDSIELIYTGRTKDPSVFPNGNVLNGNVVMPIINGTSIKSGVTAMRIVLNREPNNVISPCGIYVYGETEDYLVDIQTAPGCAGAPVAGTTTANDTSVCIGQIINLSLVGNAGASGLNYQWQLNGANIPNANSQNYTDTILGPSIYQCIVTCINSGNSTISTALTLNIKPSSLCYCTAGGLNTFGNDIGNVTVGTFSNGTASPILGNPLAINAYTDFTSLVPIPVTAGIPNAISITGITNFPIANGDTIYAKVFIDYNQDGVFDPVNELVIAGVGNYTTLNGSVISGTPIIPATALTGVTGMRVMLFDSAFTNPCYSPQFRTGEVEDYLVNIQIANFCTGLPNAGLATSTDTIICPNKPVTLNLQSASTGLGISYQWQSSTNINGPYTNVLNAANINYLTDSINTPTYFQCVSTCNNSSLTATSSPIFVDIKAFNQCYCNSNLGGSCFPNARNIVFNTLKNASIICTQGLGQAYTVFQPIDTLTTTVLKGVTYPISLTSIGTPYQITAFIDYNRDGVFDNLIERINILAYNPGNAQTVFSVPVTIPLTADTGLTGLRIRISSSSSNFTGSCDQFGLGETEDYLVRITEGLPCASLPPAINIVSSVSSVCPGTSFTLSLDTIVPAVGISYAWFINGVLQTGDTLPSFNQASNVPGTIYTCTISCNTGGSLTTPPFSIAVKPIDSCYCNNFLGGFCGFASISDFTISQNVNGTLNATSLDNTASGCNQTMFGAYSVYGINSNLTASLAKTDTFDLKVISNSLPGQVKMWADWDKNGIWNDSNELTVLCNLCTSNTNTAQFLIDSIANIGDTVRIRVRSDLNTFPMTACGFIGAGETEDYYIIIGTSTVLRTNPTLNKTIESAKFYPNPTSGILKYEIPNNTKSANIQITDLLGRTLINKKADSSKQIDLSELNNGTYTVNVILNGRLVQTKVVVNK